MIIQCETIDLKCIHMHKANNECGAAAILLCAFRAHWICKAVRTCFQYAMEVAKSQRCMGAALCACNPLHGLGAIWGVYAILCIAWEQLGVCMQSFALLESNWGCVCNLLHGWGAVWGVHAILCIAMKQLGVCMQSFAWLGGTWGCVCNPVPCYKAIGGVYAIICMAGEQF